MPPFCASPQPAGQACKAPELQKMLGEVQESLHEVLQALALAE